MPGLYLAALLVSVAGILTLDARFRLAFWAQPVPTAIAVALGTLFFVAWDAVGIASGVFVRGGSPLFIGVELFPHMPVEEPVFLAFLCHLALVAQAAWSRWRLRHRVERRVQRGGTA
ncbi:lycopene cyclase domain-containing protein [Microbacterium dextranolyticum]|uniref:Lycopene cyclase domain-containing protein n=1 Tax=Microbacterium dextranolyticum TaxID=36806 RepID=A0A9W6HNF4_9MICO|nr:lycopene cyclase domain-containing protein [Microbacterium dextranolyticum]MBM7463260.1 lycopene cyclase domain-containing protein [Microbacterium dextranolyticum]GLJ95634.1 hypothetical protein GCM10017591_16970 [Microbacterium dextranolyticum]